MDFTHLTNIAIEAALDAGNIIQQHIDKDIRVENKTAGSSRASRVVTKVDRACETAIRAHLDPTCDKFNLALLSEETVDDGSRFEKEFFWCVDPVDGTLPFIKKRPGFSVSIALVAFDGTPQIGVVYDPTSDTLYHAIKGHGVYKNKRPWKIENINNYLTYVTDRKLDDTPRAAEIEKLLHKRAEALQLNGFREMSGAGSVMNAIRVLEHGPACMFKFPKKETGGGSIWDFAATACIFEEFGLPATDFEGNPLDLNRENGTFMNHRGVFYGNFI